METTEQNQVKNTCLTLVPVKWATEWELRNLKGIIYRIVCLVNGKCYIGRTIQTFYERYKHKNWYKYIDNKILINSIKKYGKNLFKIQILEKNLFLNNALYFLEDYYAKYFNSYRPNGYNIAKCGQQDGSHNKKGGIIKSFEGEIIEFTNIFEFAKNNNLSRGLLSKLIRKKIKYYKNFCLPEDNIEEILKIKKKNKIRKTVTCILKSPTGEMVKINNKAEFCKKHNLSYGILNKVLKKEIDHCKGWVLPSTNPLTIKTKYNHVRCILYDKNTGEQIIITNITKFCRDNKYSMNEIRRLIYKKDKYKYINEYKNLTNINPKI